MPADTKSPQEKIQENLEGKVAAWRRVQERAIKTAEDRGDHILANEIRAIQTKKEWVHLVTEKLPEFTNSINTFATEEDITKITPPQAPEHEELEPDSHLGEFASDALGFGALAVEKVAEEKEPETPKNQQQTPNSGKKSTSIATIVKATPVGMAVNNSTAGIVIQNRKGIAGFVQKYIFKKDEKEKEKEKQRNKPRFQRIVEFPWRAHRKVEEGKRKKESLKKTGEEYLDNVKSGQGVVKSAIKPVLKLFGREVVLPNIPGVKQVIKVVHFVQDIFSFVRKIKKIITWTKRIIKWSKRIFNFIKNGGIEDTFNFFRNFFGGGNPVANAPGLEGSGIVEGSIATDTTAVSGGGAISGFFGAIGDFFASLGSFLLGGATGLPAAIAIVALVIIFLCLLWFFNWLFLTPHDSGTDQYLAAGAKCGYDPEITLTNIQGLIAAENAVTLTELNGQTPFTDRDAIAQDYRPFETSLFSVLCLLYGRTPDKYTGQTVKITGNLGAQGEITVASTDYVDTFGKLFLGTNKVNDAKAANGGGSTIILAFVQQQGQPCEVVPDFKSRLKANNSDFHLTVVNPQECTDGLFRFTIARAMGLAVYMRATNKYSLPGAPKLDPKLYDKVKAFDAVFNNNQTSLLPTKNCQSHQTEDECFADMVGEYMTYPIYFDSVDGSTFDTNFAYNFTQGLYKDFYEYAKDNLFDGLEIFPVNQTIGPGVCPDKSNAPTTIGDIVTFLKNTFNITLVFPNGHNSTNTKFVTDVYNTLCTLSKYHYFDLLGTNKKPLSIYLTLPSDTARNGLTQAACSGHSTQRGGDAIDLLNECGSSLGNQFVLTHELGHHLQWRNVNNLEKPWCTEVYGGDMRGSGCVPGHTHKTIPTFNCIHEGYPSECFSDMVGEFLIYKDFVAGDGSPRADLMHDFKNNFPSYYTFAALNIFTPSLTASDNGLPQVLPLLADPLPLPPNYTTDQIVQNELKDKSSLISVYKDAAKQTQIPWEVLAGIHYREADFNPNGSLVSGRALGTNEPDLHGSCSSSDTGPGKPYPLPGGGCAFHTLLDTAIYAGNLLKQKIGKTPANFEDLTQAVSRYNGTGNENCGRAPWKGCPKLWESEDSEYALNQIDTRHTGMYKIYSSDNHFNPQLTTRPGTIAIITAIIRNGIQ